MEKRLLKLLRAAGLGTTGLIAAGSVNAAVTLNEIAAYEAAVRSGSLAAFSKFLEKYPTGPLSERILQVVHDRLPPTDPLAKQIANSSGDTNADEARQLSLDVAGKLQARAEEHY